MERLHGAFNDQFSTQHTASIIQPPLEVLTPSTTNASNVSTSQSLLIPAPEESPSSRNVARRVEEATALDNYLTDPISDEANETGTGFPAWPLSESRISESDNAGARPDLPIPRRDLFDQMEPFDYNQYMQPNEDAELNNPQPELDGDQFAWNDAFEIADNDELFDLEDPL
jgi:hypothetical protein